MSRDDATPALPRRSFVAGLLGLAGCAVSTGAGVSWQGPRVRGSGWLEWRLDAPSAAEPAPCFDPARFDLWCDFTGPGGRALRATAFWNDDGRGGHWLLRLLPPASGRWQAAPRARIDGAAAAPLGAPFAFDVSRVPARQRVVVDPAAPGGFAFDDGTPFVPVGLNLCWSTGTDPLRDYRRWLARLAEQGGNFIRLWMASWAFGIEWKDTGLGDYSRRMERAAQLDAVLEIAESLDIRVMLCLVNHGAFTERNDSEWKDNPYNRANGGPLAAPEDFVTDERAIALFERRMRYIAARWSASPALHSWEWWNEATWTPLDPTALRPWFTRMARVLDAHDPYRRLRTTSWADRGDAAAWQLPALDYAQQHDYTERDLVLHYAGAAREWAGDGITKPRVPGELGLQTSHDAKRPQPYPFDAVHLHNGLWAPLFHGYASTALYWWWDPLVDAKNLWPTYRGVARWLQAVHAAGLRLAAHRPRRAAFSGGEAGVLALVGAASVLLWVRADRLDAATLERAWRTETGGDDPRRPWQPTFPSIQGGRVRLEGLALADGTLRVRWFDAATGNPLPASQAVLRGGAIDIACPPFGRDLAAIAERA